ncbi:MAG: hypothetical protein K9H64_09505 [Bacteroidales bacterium]|nr:hypothetical protein [Bacteroidales bacterium]MCF8456101.1 hypothetical protein [Bacteroidales bacterium]
MKDITLNVVDSKMNITENIVLREVFNTDGHGTEYQVYIRRFKETPEYQVGAIDKLTGDFYITPAVKENSRISKESFSTIAEWINRNL